MRHFRLKIPIECPSCNNLFYKERNAKRCRACIKEDIPESRIRECLNCFIKFHIKNTIQIYCCFSCRMERYKKDNRRYKRKKQKVCKHKKKIYNNNYIIRKKKELGLAEYSAKQKERRIRYKLSKKYNEKVNNKWAEREYKYIKRSAKHPWKSSV